MKRPRPYPPKAAALDRRISAALRTAFRRGDLQRLERHLKRDAVLGRGRRLIYRVSIVSEFWNLRRSEFPISHKELGTLTVAHTLDGKLRSSIRLD